MEVYTIDKRHDVEITLVNSTDYDKKMSITDLVSLSKLSIDYLDKCNYLFAAILKDSNMVVGCVGLETRYSNGEMTWFIQSLCVHPEYRHQGLGRLLVEYIEKYPLPGQMIIAFTMFWNNTFYRKLGYIKGNPKIKQLSDIGRREKHRFCVAWCKRIEENQDGNIHDTRLA